MLDRLVQQLNKVLGNPVTPKYEVGHIYLSKMAGVGYSIEKVVNKAGAVTTLVTYSRQDAKTTCLMLQSMLNAIELYKEANQPPAKEEPVKPTMSLKATCAIASVINSAFETGIGAGSWWQNDGLNRDGFLDAAFADELPKSPVGKGVKGNDPKPNWTLRTRLCDYEESSEEEFPWVVITPESVMARWREYAADTTKAKFPRSKVSAYIKYIESLDAGDFDLAEEILWKHYEPDGVHDDIMAQAAVCGDVIFG